MSRHFVVPLLVLAVAVATPLLAHSSQREQHRVEEKVLTTPHPAEQKALLWNWVGARDDFRIDEQRFAASHDERNRLRAHIGYLRSSLEFSSVRSVNAELDALLNSPVVQHDPSLKLRALIAKGDCVFQLDVNEAYNTWSAVAHLADQLNDDIWKNRASAELGTVEFYRGNVFKALQMVSAALAKAEATGDVGAEIRYRAVLGEGFLEAHRYADALHLFEQSISTANHTEYASPPFTALLGRARALIALHKENEGLPELRGLLADSKKQGLRVRQTRVLSALSDYFSVNEITGPETAALSIECYEIASKDGLARLSASSAARLAGYYTRTGNRAKAEQYARATVAACKSGKDVYNLPESLAALAEIQEANGHTHEAAQTYDQAIAGIDDVLSRIPSVGVRNAILGELTPIYGRYLSLLVSRLHDNYGAFRLIEQARARSIDDFLIQGAAQQPSIKPLFLPRLSSLHWALRKERQPDQRMKLSEELWELERRATTRVAPTAPLHQIPLPTIAQVQAALKPEEALLIYALAAPRSFVIVIARGSFSIHTIGNSSGVASRISTLLQAIKNHHPAMDAIDALSATLVRCIPKELLRPDMIIVPDGKLNALPFELLRDNRDQILLWNHSISYTPSAAAWRWLRVHDSPTSAPEAFLGVGGVMYEGRLMAPTRTVTSGASIFSTGAAPRFDQLASSGDEVISVSKLLNAPTTDILVRENATEEHFKHLDLSRYTLMHFAVHSTLDEEFSERSALLLGDSRNSSEDGLLQAREIRRLPIHARLVTLSACNTAVGEGNGLSTYGSLVQGFLTAGAHSVLATDWAVDDKMTAQLMGAFYRHLGSGMTERRALRRAKLDVIQNFGVLDLPYYWAGFRLTGDGGEQFGEGSKNNVRGIRIHNNKGGAYIAAAGNDTTARP